MRFCPNCGAKLEEDDAKFCQECGTNVQEFGEAPEQSVPSGESGQNEKKITYKKPGNNKKSSYIMIGGAACILVLILFLLVNHKPSIELNEYLKTSYSGFNGNASAYCRLDTEGLEEAVQEKTRLEGDQWEKLDSALSYLQDQLTISQSEELSNGDKVKITVENKDVVVSRFKKLGVKLKIKDITLKIKDLSEIRHVLLSSDLIRISVSGYEEAPNISFNVNRDALADQTHLDKDNELDNEEITWIYKYLNDNVTITPEEDRSSLVNGAQAKFKIEVYNPEEYSSDLGIIFDSGEYETELKGLAPMKEVNLADLISVDVEGVVPNLYLNTECDYSKDASNIITGWTPESGDYNGNNGDTISVDVNYDSDLATEMGYKVTNTHKEVTISGLDTYEVDCSDLTSANWQELLELREKGVRDRYMDWDELMDIMNQEFADNGYRILWDYFDIQPYEVGVTYYERENSSGNVVSLIFSIQAAVVRKDDSIGVHTFYHAVNMRNLFSEEGGSLTESGDYYDDGREGKYYTTEELDKLPGEIESYLKEDDPNTKVQYSSAMYPGEEANAVPGNVGKTKTEEAAYLDVKENRTAPALDPEAEAQASAMIEYDGHKYYRFDIAWSWREAETFCEKYGYHLASVNNEKERKLIYALLAGDGIPECQFGSYWVGGNYKDRNWIWTDGSDASDMPWQNGSSDNNVKENPVTYVYASDYAYISNTINMAENIGFIMEVYDQNEAEENCNYLETCRISEGKNVRYVVQDSYSEMHYAVTHLDDSDDWYGEYELNGNYASFSGILYPGDGAGSDVSMNITFWGDGKLLYHQADINRQSTGIPFNVNVTGVQDLKIELYNTGSEYAEVLLDMGKLYKADAPSNSCDYVQLSELEPIDGRGYSISNNSMWRDNIGHWKTDYISMEADQGGFAVWNLDQKYSRADITCTIPNCGTGDTSITVNVYGDNVLLDSREMLNKTSDAYVFPSDIDLSDVKLLKIEVINEADEYDTYGYLVDSRLYLK